MLETGLPTTLLVDGEAKKIRTDFRTIIIIMCALNDPELDDQDRVFAMLELLYVDDWTTFSDITEAGRQATWFIDCGTIDETEMSDRPNSTKLMDWEQDYNIIIPAINRVAGKEIRAEEYCHWWTFIGYYKEIGECFFSQVVNIRVKLNKGVKLEKWEKEFLRENRRQVILKSKLTEEEQKEIDDLWGGD